MSKNEKPPGENVQRITDLSVYHSSSGYGYVVVNQETDGVYTVDMAYPPSCGCKDFEFNKDKKRGEACKHIKKVALVGPSQQSVEERAFENLANLASEAQQAVDSIKDVRDSAQAARTADAQAAVADGPEADEVTTESQPQETEDVASDAAQRLEDAFGDVVEDMQVMPANGLVWFQTGQDTPDEWPFPGGDSTFQVLTEPDAVKWVHDGSPDWADSPHPDYDDKPGEWYKNAIEPEDVDQYISEVLE